ncbi:MAG: FMN-dependent NADH-azoreductase [Mycoplasma sp.]|nr:FMN-dependent NADH-azoreductase [Mycoplasma sp.]
MNFFFNEKDSDYYINLLKSYQKIIITTQMVNFNIPTTLKNFLDHILVANKTFSYKYSKKGEAIGLLKDHNIKIQILATQGAPKGWYPWGDHVANLKGSLEFMGLIVFEPILIDGTKLVLDIDPNEYIKKWENEIKEKALKF